MNRISTDSLRTRIAELRRFIANGETEPAEGAEQLTVLEKQLTAVELQEAAEAKANGQKEKDVRRALAETYPLGRRK
jgi:hypothetical protein